MTLVLYIQPIERKHHEAFVYVLNTTWNKTKQNGVEYGHVQEETCQYISNAI